MENNFINLTSNQKLILSNLGFKPYSYTYLYGETYYLNVDIFVTGDHATDYARVLYSTDANIKGFCYSSSLLASLISVYGDNKGLNDILKKVNKYSDCEIKLTYAGDGAYFYIPCDLINDNYKYALSDMVKLIGQVDYFVQQRLSYNYKKTGKVRGG